MIIVIRNNWLQYLTLISTRLVCYPHENQFSFSMLFTNIKNNYNLIVTKN